LFADHAHIPLDPWSIKSPKSLRTSVILPALV
jgi:hypothetical protein